MQEKSPPSRKQPARNPPNYSGLAEAAGEVEEDEDKRKKGEEKSGQTNYYVHCVLKCESVSMCGGGGGGWGGLWLCLSYYRHGNRV